MKNVTHTWMRAVRDHGGSLEPRARLAAHTVASYADADGENCYPSVPTIARGMGVSDRTAQRALDDLEQAGWLVRWYRSDRSTVYRFLIPDEALAGAVDEALDEAGVTSVHAPVTGRCTGVLGWCICAPLTSQVSPDHVSTTSLTTTDRRSPPRAVRRQAARAQRRAGPAPRDGWPEQSSDTAGRW